LLLAFEGIDGSGKTSISKMVVSKMQSKCSIHWYEKSSDVFPNNYVNDQMRTLKKLLWPDDDGSNHKILGDLYWLFLTAAWFSVLNKCRNDEFQSTDELVVYDSWYYRFVAKFCNKGFDRKWLMSLFSNVVEPNLVILLDIDPKMAWERRTKFKEPEMGRSDGLVGDKFQSYCIYQGNIRRTLLTFATERSWLIIRQKENESQKTISDTICEHLYKHFKWQHPKLR